MRSTPQVSHLLTKRPPDWCERQLNKYVDHRHYDTLISGDRPVKYLKPNGEPLLYFCPNALSPEVCEAARPILRRAANKRGEWRKGLTGGVVGYFDKPTCRLTEFTARYLREWEELQPFIFECSSVFRRHLPSRYLPQRNLTFETDPRYVIDGTAFTTVTVNLWNERHCARTRVHRDAGDLPQGFGVISVLRAGEFSGGELIFPEYGVAVDLKTTDVLLCDVHELHGNANITPTSPDWERIATISYFRTGLAACTKPEAETDEPES